MAENIIQINSSGGGPYIVTHNSPSSGYVTVMDTASGNSIVIDISSVSGGGGGAATSITFSPTGNITSTNVQTAIVELDSETLHLTGAETITGVKTFSIQPSGIVAGSIVNTPAGNISATNIQSAINELDTEKITSNAPIIGNTFTKITFDSKGLITSGANATAADIINVPSGNISSTTVQAALNEIDSEVLHLAGNESITGIKTFSTQPSGINASSIVNTAAGNISAVTVQAAINELDTEKVSSNIAITGATFTKITYDSKGLVTSGVNATATDIINTPSGNIAALTVQAALNELDVEKVNTSTFITTGDTIRGTGAGTYVRVRNNYSAAVNPSITDDSSVGFLIGSRWINTTTDTEYVCVDNTASGAIWQQASNLLSQMRYLAMIY
jgi:hypothetical protein